MSKSFRRTPSGQANLHIFKNVEHIIYTEGGGQEPLTKQKILEGLGYEHSNDVKFWKGVFDTIHPNKTVKILSVGSSKVLDSIAEDIVENSLTNVSVAFDSDYKNIWGTKLHHHNVLYTRTYSWENELFNVDVILKAFNKLLLNNYEGDVMGEIVSSRERILKCLRPFFFADIVLVAANQSFFCRKKEGFCFSAVRNSTFPFVDLTRMRGELKSKHKKLGKFRLSKPVEDWNVARDMYGKPLLFAARAILRTLIYRANQPAVANDYLDKFLIESFIEWLQENRDSDIYRGYFSELNEVA